MGALHVSGQLLFALGSRLKMTEGRMPTQNILLVLVIYICVNCLVVQDRSNMGRQMKSRAEASMRRIVERVTSTQLHRFLAFKKKLWLFFGR